MRQIQLILFCLMLSLGLIACQSAGQQQASSSPAQPQRIVSLAGSITEILYAADLQDRLAGVDVTSTYPPATADLPKVGHNRNIQAEGILTLNPDLVIGRANELKPAVEQQLRQAGLELVLLPQEYTVAGTKRLIRQVCDTLDQDDVAEKLIQTIDADLGRVQPLAAPPRAMFIYARGAGTLMVAGEGTQMQQMLELAGATNAVQGFADFKPLTPEALVEANPEVIVLFDSGLSSLEGADGLLEVPGVAQTIAGQQRAFITMDGQLLAGFGPRVGQAAAQLNAALRRLTKAQPMASSPGTSE
jgi:iron complex transport system substrate-binding protein